MKIIKVFNCRECQYKDTYIGNHFWDNYKYCRLKYIKTGEIKKIENKEVIAEWCDLPDYKDSLSNILGV